MSLESKASTKHYVVLGLTLLGFWYVLEMWAGKSGFGSPVAQTVADISTIVIVGG